MQKIKYAYAITLAFLSFTNAIPVGAKPELPRVTAPSRDVTTPNQSDPNKKPRFTLPPFPPSGTPVGRRRGAAGRSGVGNCALNPPLTALAPATQKSLSNGKATYVWGKTTAEYPTFWFYLPGGSSLRSVEFVLQDQQDNDVYRTQVNIPEQPGIVSFRLPSTASPLQLNQNYRWFLKTEIAVDCQQQNSSAIKDSVEGWIQRVNLEPQFTTQLAAATPKQQIALYAQQGFWYDALTTLAELRRHDPTDASLKADWHELLQSTSLGELASKSLIQCCTPAN